jgi:hypothetical protein
MEGSWRIRIEVCASGRRSRLTQVREHVIKMLLDPRGSADEEKRHEHVLHLHDLSPHAGSESGTGAADVL